MTLAAASLTVVSAAASAGVRSRPNVHPGECLQGQLRVAMEPGGGVAGTVPRTLGYTFLVVEIGARSCTLQGYPYEIIFSTARGQQVKVAVSHRPTELYAQPASARVVLRPGRVASFGISYRYAVAPPTPDPSSCVAELLDLRLPARASKLFSYEFPIRFDACAAHERVEVTPVEARSAPQP